MEKEFVGAREYEYDRDLGRGSTDIHIHIYIYCLFVLESDSTWSWTKLYKVVVLAPKSRLGNMIDWGLIT